MLTTMLVMIATHMEIGDTKCYWDIRKNDDPEGPCLATPISLVMSHCVSTCCG